MHWQRNGIGRTALILLVGLALGFLLSVGWRSLDERGSSDSVRGSSRIKLSMERLETEQQDLKAELANLRQELAERRQEVAANTDRLQDLNAELDRQRLLAGLVPVQGAGVRVILDDSNVDVSSGTDPKDYIIHEYDLRDIVNLLWMADSDAVAINEERLVSGSSVYCVGSTVMVNNTRLSPPYQIRAIGDSRIQQDYLRNPSYLVGLKEKNRRYGLRFDVQAVSRQTLPAYSGGFLVNYARPGE